MARTPLTDDMLVLLQERLDAFLAHDLCFTAMTLDRCEETARQWRLAQDRLARAREALPELPYTA